MQDAQQEPIAIIGMGCRFPQASGLREFWQLLAEGRDGIREIPPERWDRKELYDPDLTKPGKMMSHWGGFIDQVDRFDWRAFRLLPREVKHMDPQQRLLLEVAWEALEDAGLPLAEIAGTKTSVAVGIGWSDFLRLQTRDWSQVDGYTAMGSAASFAANRISYIFNLRGPSVSLDAGCTSSLMALYFACQNLWHREADMALVGGVNLILSPDSMIMASKAGLLSPDGCCKTLDAHANGIVRGEGAGMVVLKPLSQVKRSDRVYALISGVGVNHNGHNEWMIAANQKAQESLLEDVYCKAGINPGDVDYVELHGTGFQRGDSIEAKALGAVLGVHSMRTHPCLIGSVKTNIGHLESAAGIAGLIKVALSLYHRQIPPTLHIQTIHPNISLKELQVDVPLALTSWPEQSNFPVAGITAISFTGANAHAVLAAHSAPIQSGVQSAPELRLLPLSARTEEALYAQAASWRTFLLQQGEEREASWSDICYTASVRRTHHEYRLAIVGRTVQEAALALEACIRQYQSGACETRVVPQQGHKIIFAFARHNPACSKIAYEALLTIPAFMEAVEACALVFQELSGQSLLQETAQGKRFNQSIHLDIVLCILQIAMTALWRCWGIQADAVLGDGLGEVVASYIAGSLSLYEALTIIVSSVYELPNGKHYDRLMSSKQTASAAIPVYSASQGLLDETQLQSVTYWSSLCKQQPLSVAVFDTLLHSGYDIFVEIGPTSSVSGAFLARTQEQNYPAVLLPTYTRKPVEVVMVETLAKLYMLGETVHWSNLQRDEGRCVSLPTYAWQRERLWPAWLTAEYIGTPPEEAGNSSVQTTTQQSVQSKGIINQSLENTLVDLWTEILDLPVRPEDSFFEMGGHSLLAAQLLARIKEVLHVEVALHDLLYAPSPRTCATLVEQIRLSNPERVATDNQWPVIVPDPSARYEPFRITDIQQAYWVGRSNAFDVGNVGNHAYAEADAVNLDLARFERAVQRVIERHDMLRAILLPDGRQQVLAKVDVFALHIEDLRALDEEEKTTRLVQIRQELDHQILPVEQWPAFELRLSRLDEQRTRIHLSIESLFIDAWSMNIILQEFIRFYHLPELKLPALELSFRDYLQAEEQLQGSALYQRSKEYWQQRIPSLPPAPDLPLAVRYDTQGNPHFVHREACLDVESWKRLKERSAQAGVTSSGVLLTAFAQILATWSRNSRFCVNLSTFNRLSLHPQVNEIVGDFTSLLVLAVDYSTPDTFENRAKRLQEQLWVDLDHSYYSGIQLLRDLAKHQGDMTRAVMPVVFTSLLIKDLSHSYPPPWQEVGYCVSQTPQVWIDHQVHETRGELVLHWQSVDALFPDGLIDAMFEAYCQLLHRLAEAEEVWHEPYLSLVPQAQLAQRIQGNDTVALISEQTGGQGGQGQGQSLRGGGEGGGQGAGSGSLQAFFIEQAERQPYQLAVIASTQTLTYKEVYSGMFQVAYQLRAWGAQPNQLVGVVMEKGWEQIVAVLGVLQAGAAYLPLDAHLPRERLHYLLEHGLVDIVLTQSRFDVTLKWPAHLKRICIDHLDMSKSELPVVETMQQSEDLAYVIYTSGSTGLPKGVMIDHRGAVNTILDINQRFRVSNHDRVLALSALNFDLSVYDIFGTLAAGGTIVLPDEASIRNPDSWLEILTRERVTIWNSVPALLQMFVEYVESQPDAIQQGSLRLALLSGDWIPVTLPDRIRKLVPEIEVVSLGGATEASIWSVLYPIAEVLPFWKSIPYGKPMVNQGIVVLNDLLEPCPVWVPGHIYISGIGLAKGYWRDEKKTNESFFYHPRSGERLYRTGDLGRYLPDGNIEFLGREDFQVKVLGHRIELGEIEETLLRHPAVREAVATTVTAADNTKRLAAYVVLHAEQEITRREVPADAYTLAQLVTSAQEFSQDARSVGPNGQGQAGQGQALSLRFGGGSLRGGQDCRMFTLTDALSDSARLQRYRTRLSYRQFLAEPITLAQFSGFLSNLAQIELDGLPKYLYPSAGGIYPVEAYLYIKPGRIADLPEGIYQYQPYNHRLVLLTEGGQLSRNIHATINQPIFDHSVFSLFLIANLPLIEAQYGAAARDFCLLEAGYMGQLLMMAGIEQQIGLCPIGGLNFTTIKPLFHLDEGHILLHSLLGGRIDPAAAAGWSFLPPETGQSQAPATSLPIDMSGSLRDFLRERLPEYMVPTSIMILDKLPLTANGKVDRGHLPAPERHIVEVPNVFVAPKSDLERKIAAVWQEVLSAPTVGTHDNFFDLGGNSLLMIKAYTGLRKVLQQDIPMVTMFFQYPTIHLLAQFLTQERQPAAEGERVKQDLPRVERRSTMIQQERLARLKHRSIERENGDAEPNSF